MQMKWISVVLDRLQYPESKQLVSHLEAQSFEWDVTYVWDAYQMLSSVPLAFALHLQFH